MAGRQASAVIVRARLPAGLERLRRRSVVDAAKGVPAHLTLLYPFVEPSSLDVVVRRAITAVAARHAPFDYRLDRAARWPDTIYVAVTPVEPFVALETDLARAFPDYPIYGEPPGFTFVPHVTIAEGSSIDDAATARDPGWAELPRAAHASAIEVIASDRGGWRLVWRVRLGHRGRR
jgi:2'-5' RNA ligase